MKAYVINLERSVDRRHYMEKIMRKMPYFDCEYIKAIDGTRLTEEEKRRKVDFAAMKKRYVRHINDGELGCALSHQLCYQTFLASGQSCCFIFEDDVTVKRDIRRELAELRPIYESQSPTLILFSGWYWYNKKIFCGSVRLAQVWDGYLAQAYLINRAAAEIMTAEKISLLSDDWAAIRRKGVRIYGVLPHAFDQEWNELQTTIGHGARLPKGLYPAKLLIAYRIARQKLHEKMGKFETCDYIEKGCLEELKKGTVRGVNG